MSLTALTAVTRRLVAEPVPGSAEESPAGLPGLVLRALGLRPDQLPARTTIYLGGVPPLPGPATADDGIPVRTAATAALALHLADQELHSEEADFALVGTVDGAAGGDTPTVTVHTLRRAAEAVAEGDPVVGLLDPTQEPPLCPLRHGHASADPDGPRLLLWSGADEDDEALVRRELRPLVEGLCAQTVAELPVVVPRGRSAGAVRAAAVGTAVQIPALVEAAKAVRTGRPRPVGLLFPGQGSQHTAMAAGLYGREPVFTAAADAVLDLMGEDGPRIRADWLGDEPRIGIDDVRRAQPLLFAVDYALGRMVLSWGVRPTALLGHSAGELVAATLAGVVSLPDGVRMMRERVRHAVRIPAGGMLAVAASEDQLRPYLTGDVAIAAVNANQQTMLAGSCEPLADVETRLRADGYTAVAVPATSPFHCPAMAPASEAVERAYARLRLRPPRLPFYSGYTGRLMTDENALSPRFWAWQLTDTVYFGPALDELLAADDMLLIEVGPRQTLTAFARRHRAVRRGASAVVPLLPARNGPPEADRQSVLTAAARLWTEGHELDHDAVSRLWSWSGDASRALASAVVA